MALLCLSYFAAVGTCVGVAGLLAEHALPAAAPRRWVWSLVLATSIMAPPLISAHHSSAVIGLWGLDLVQLPSRHSLAAASHPSVDRNWLDCGAAYGQAFMRLWSITTALLLAWGLASSLRLSHVTRASRGATRGARAGQTIVDAVPVVVTDSLGPATAGFWRVRVLVPRWVLALPAGQRRYVLRHEEEHRRAHDARLLVVASLFVSLFPWNLPLWWQLRRLRLAVEMDCDRRVVSALGDARAYGAMLLGVAQAASRGPRLQPALLGRVGMLERRLRMLLAPPPRRFARRFAAPALALALLYVVLSAPHPELGSDAVAGRAPHAGHVEPQQSGAAVPSTAAARRSATR